MSVLQGPAGATNAATMLEGVLEEVPGWYDALRVLGRLYPRLPGKAGSAAGGAAAALRGAAAAKHGQRAELWEILGDILAGQDPAGGREGRAGGRGAGCRAGRGGAA